MAMVLLTLRLREREREREREKEREREREKEREREGGRDPIATLHVTSKQAVFSCNNSNNNSGIFSHSFRKVKCVTS